MTPSHLALVLIGFGSPGLALADFSRHADYAATVSATRHLFEGKSFIRSDGVHSRYSQWEGSETGGSIQRVMDIPGIADPIKVTETFTVESGVLVMMEDVTNGQEHPTFTATLTKRGGILYLPFAGVAPQFVSSECWTERDRTQCKIQRKNPDGTTAVIEAHEDD